MNEILTGVASQLMAEGGKYLFNKMVYGDAPNPVHPQDPYLDKGTGQNPPQESVTKTPIEEMKRPPGARTNITPIRPREQVKLYGWFGDIHPRDLIDERTREIYNQYITQMRPVSQRGKQTLVHYYPDPDESVYSPPQKSRPPQDYLAFPTGVYIGF